MNKTNKCVFLITIAFFWCPIVYGIMDDFGDIDLSQIEAYEQAHPLNPFALRLDANVLAAFLENNVTESIWKSTVAPAGRDILYLLPHKITAVEYGGFAVNLFFNMTNNMGVTTEDLIDLGSLLTQEQLLELISFYLGGGDRQDFEQLLPLFSKITLQERKAGLLLQSAFTKGPFTVQLHTSVQLGERNFWLDPKDSNAIKRIFREKFGSESEIDEREFYIIRVGMGDTRLKVGLNAVNMTSLQADVGFECIVPTSRLSYTPKISIGLTQPSFEEGELAKSGLNTLRGIRDYLINPRLGNNGHIGLGCYFESKVGLFHEIVQLWIRASHDVLFPADEDRLFMFKQTLKPEDLQRVLDNTPQDQQLVTDYIRQYVFPSSFKASVYPGGVTNFVCAVNVDFAQRWRGAFGYDFYAQNKERIKKILNTSIDLNDLRVEDAQLSAVSQHKIFAEALYRKKKVKSDWGVGFGGDLTVSNKNIGDDWTLYLKFASSF